MNLENPILVTIIQIVAYITPFFLIPATFKFGMGVFGNLTGMVNDRSRGIFDRQRKFREANKAKYRERARQGNRFAGGNSTNLRGRMNRGIATGFNAPSAISASGSTFKPGNWASATRSQMQDTDISEIERNMKENQAYQSWMYDDGLNKAAAETNNSQQLRDRLSRMRDENGRPEYEGRALDDAVNRVETVRRTMGVESFRAMTTRQAIAGGTAIKDSKIIDADGNEIDNVDAGLAWGMVARAAGNNDAMAQYLIANGRSEGMKAGRIDTSGAGFGTTMVSVNKMRQELAQTGAISTKTIVDVSKDIHKDVLSGQGGTSLVHASMKPTAVKQMASTMLESVTSSTGNSQQFARSLASMAAVYDGMAGSSPNKAVVMADEVMSKQINLSGVDDATRALLSNGAVGGQITVQKAIEAMRNDTNFREMRREYGSEVAARLGQPAVNEEEQK